MDPLEALLISIVVIGSVGNLISIGIFSRIKQINGLSRMNVNNMIIAKLLTDTLNLLLGVTGFIPGLANGNLLFYCQICTLLSYLLPAYSAWILVLVSIERLVTVFFSTNQIANLFKNSFFQLASLFVMLVIGILYYIPTLYSTVGYYSIVNGTFVLMDQPTSNYYCNLSDFYTVLVYVMNMPFAVFVPFILLITSSLLIIYSMTLLRKRINMHNNNNNNTDINKRREKRDLDYAKTILFLDITFLFFYFPYVLILVIGNYYTNYDTFAALVFFFLYYIGFGNNIFVYLAASKSFRKEINTCVKTY